MLNKLYGKLNAELKDIDYEAGSSNVHIDQNLRTISVDTADVDSKLDTEISRATSVENSINANLLAHSANTSNPHAVTKTQVGLGNVDNTSDADKPISTSIQAALDIKLNGLVSILYTDLKGLRDANQLISGQQYRITDYTCTTTQAETQSAGHQFDVIVVADSTNQLNENARAIQHIGDTYFANCKLGSWQLKYCIDNDTTRFAWADSVNGKGVIYWMKDEYNNECPYDFKNIQFKRYAVKDDSTGGILASLGGKFLGFLSGMQSLSIPDTTNFIWCYTFSYKYYAIETIYDMSILNFIFTEAQAGEQYNEVVKGCRNNGIESNNVLVSIDNNGIHRVMSLNNITFMNTQKEEGELMQDLLQNYVGSNCQDLACIDSDKNRFGAECHSFVMTRNYSNTFGNSCSLNTFGDACRKNTFGNNWWNNTFGSNCNENTFGNYCWNNTFGNYCCNNTFGNYCDGNIFGNSCISNTFGSDCNNNTFGSGCRNNTFANGCKGNIFGIYCNDNTLGNGVRNITLDTYAQWNIFENGVQYLKVVGSTSGNYSNLLQNITICQGLSGTDSSIKTIQVTRNLTQQIRYVKAGSSTVEVA